MCPAHGWQTSIILLPHGDLLSDRYSEREERRCASSLLSACCTDTRKAHGRIRTQAEVEAAKAV
jgi:hypothetical protein